MLKIGIIGCGYSSYYYCISLLNYPDVKLMGVYDRNDHKSVLLSQHQKCRKYFTFQEMLNDKEIDMIVNLTTPLSHFEINKQILQSGKHLYSEKPITLSLKDFDILEDIARKKNLSILSAPANYLANYFHNLMDVLPHIGRIEKVVAFITEKDIPYDKIINPLKVKWNIHSELETGCNLEHAGYILSLMTTLFGEVKNVVKSSKALSKVRKRYGEKTYHVFTHDTYRSEMEIGSAGAKLIMINSINYDNNKSITFYGEKGKVILKDIWNFNSDIFLNDKKIINKRTEHFKQSWILYMDLMRPIGYFEKGYPVMQPKQIRNILETMLKIQS